MILATDVYYWDDKARAAGVLFEEWTDSCPVGQVTAFIDHPGEYEPGFFYRRELPCLMALMKQTDLPVDTVIVDGYVYLDNQQRPGLGYHLYQALSEQVPVIGVAKTSFHDNTAWVKEVYRGASKKPLYVTAIGIELDAAAGYVQNMHGQYRFPTLLKQVDTLSREMDQIGI